jgi:hypothetical protein
MTGNIYSIGMHIVLAGNALAGLQAISKHLAGIHTQVGQIHTGWKNWAAILGVGGIAAGVGIIGGMKKIADHGAVMVDQQIKLINAGYKENEILKLKADYYERIAKAVPTSTVTTYMKTVGDMRSITGDGPGSLEKAQALAEQAIRMDTLLANRFGTKEGEYFKYLRSTEMKGIATNDEKRNDFLSRAFSYSTAFGTKLPPGEWQTFAQRAGPMFMNMDMEKSMGPVAVSIADLKGNGAGTAAMTLYNSLLGARTLSQQQFKQFSEIGLINEDKVHSNGHGRMMLDPGAVVGGLEHVGDLPGWVHEELWPKLMKAAKGDRNMAAIMLAKLFPDRNAQRMAMMYGDEGFRDQIAKDMGLAAMTLPEKEQYQNLINKSPVGVKQAFHDQFESMMQSIGGPLAQAAIPVMKQLTEVFTTIGQWANSHPETIKMIGTALAGLGAVLIVFGTGALIAAMASFAAGGAAVVAIGALAAGLITLAALNWDSIKKGFETVVGWLTTLFEKFKSFVGGAGTGPTAPPGGGSYDAMGNYTPSAYHPGGGANDNYTGGGSIKDAARARAFGASGSSMMSYAMDQLRKEGVPESSLHAAAANLVGQAYMESGLDPSKVHDGGTGYGIYGARLGRRAAMFQWLSAHGYARNSAEGQMRYMAHEAMSGRYGFTKHALQSGLFGDGITNRITKEFESPAVINRRHDAVMRAYRSDRSRKAITEGVTPPPKKESQPVIQFDAHLDGEVLSRSVTKRQSRSSMFATSSGDIDPHGRYHDAGTRFSDVG